MKRLIQLFQSQPAILACLLACVPLATALFSQYAFGTFPCELCIYQRYPYLLAAVFAVLAWILKKATISTWLIWLVVLAFLTSSGIAWYHVAVEQGWVEAPAGCAVATGANASLDALKAQIMGAALVSCKDVGASLFGISMPVWNGLYGMAAAAVVTVWMLRKQR